MIEQIGLEKIEFYLWLIDSAIFLILAVSSFGYDDINSWEKNIIFFWTEFDVEI